MVLSPGFVYGPRTYSKSRIKILCKKYSLTTSRFWQQAELLKSDLGERSSPSLCDSVNSFTMVRCILLLINELLIFKKLF